MDRKTKFLLIFASLLCIVGFVLTPIALATGNVTIPDPLNLGPGGFVTLLGRIVTGVGTLIASLGTIMIIVAGILYLTSAGNPERMGTAKKALVYAIIGIVIGLAATAIVEIIKQTIGAPTS